VLKVELFEVRIGRHGMEYYSLSMYWKSGLFGERLRYVLVERCSGLVIVSSTIV